MSRRCPSRNNAVCNADLFQSVGFGQSGLKTWTSARRAKDPYPNCGKLVTRVYISAKCFTAFEWSFRCISKCKLVYTRSIESVGYIYILSFYQSFHGQIERGHDLMGKQTLFNLCMTTLEVMACSFPVHRHCILKMKKQG